MFTPGTHRVRVQSTELGRTSTGKPQLAIRFTDGTNSITAFRFFTENSLEYTEKDLQVLGWDPTANGWEIDRLHQSDVLLDAEADIVVEEDYYKGKAKLRVKFINEPGSGGGLKETMSTQEALSFAAELRARVMGGTAPAAPAQRPAAQPASAAPQGGLGPDDDIPF